MMHCIEIKGFGSSNVWKVSTFVFNKKVSVGDGCLCYDKASDIVAWFYVEDIDEPNQMVRIRLNNMIYDGEE